MKTIYLKSSLWLAATVLTSLCASAQTKTSETPPRAEANHPNYNIRNEGNHHTENVETNYQGKAYHLRWLDEKLTELAVDGINVPKTNWNQYRDVINRFRAEIKAQAKRNAEQAKRNAEQARRNAEQQKRNAEQADRNQQQTQLNEQQAKRNEEQNRLNAKQEKRNEEQAHHNEEQARKNDAQAKAMQELIKNITTDLVHDLLIKDAHDLRQLNFKDNGMSVNGVKQPAALAKKYREKYPKEKYAVLYDNFNYLRDGIIDGR